MPLKHALARLKILQEIMSRAKRGSRNRQKLRVRIARLHRRIANIRSHAIHKLTAFLASNYSEVVIEDLNVKGMMANHHLARAI
ncbi:MAG: transposase, partial [Sutterella sp.]|nr:transposase [Sutterella sp.]